MVRAKSESQGNVAATWIGRGKTWAGAFIDARGLFWALLFFVLAFIIPVAGGVGALVWLRGSLFDFLKADVKIWHLLVALALEAAGALVIVLWWRPFPAKETDRAPFRYPTEIAHFGVLWPVIAVESLSSRSITHFEVGKPMCPKHRSVLGLVLVLDASDGEERRVVPMPDDLWEKLSAAHMFFHCFNDRERFDLRDCGYGMGTARNVVDSLAMGEYRIARAAWLRA